MTTSTVNTNMFFPEFPDDAFDAFDLPAPPTFAEFVEGVPVDPFDVHMHPEFVDAPPLSRTYKAHCPRCWVRTETYSRNNRVVACADCYDFAVLTCQRIRRGMVVRRRLVNKRRSEMMYRWFLMNKVDGSDLAWNIMKFV